MLPQLGGVVIGTIGGLLPGYWLHLGVDTFVPQSLQIPANEAAFGLSILVGAGFGYVNGLAATPFAEDGRAWRQKFRSSSQ